MTPDEQFAPPVEVGLEANLEPKQFLTPNDIQLWMNEQTAFYTDLIGTHSSSDQALQNAWMTISGWLQDGPNRFNKLRNQSNPSQEQYVQTLNRYTKVLKEKNLFDAKSPVANFLRTLQSSDPLLAAHTAVVLSKAPVQLQSTQSQLWLEAGAMAAAWKHGWLNKIPDEAASLNDFKNEWQKRFQDTERELLAAKSLIEHQVDAGEKRRAESEQALNALLEAATVTQQQLTAKTDEAIKEGHSQIADFKNAYNQALALRAPNMYWRAKQKEHQVAAGWWFAAFAVSASVTILGVWYVWHLTVENRFTTEPPPYTSFIPSIGAALLGAWFMRVFSRQIVSNLALSSDAGERVAMVQTYLALTEGGHAKESDRGLILSSLFRSAAKTSDDGAPPTISDALVKFLRGEK